MQCTHTRRWLKTPATQQLYPPDLVSGMVCGFALADWVVVKWLFFCLLFALLLISRLSLGVMEIEVSRTLAAVHGMRRLQWGHIYILRWCSGPEKRIFCIVALLCICVESYFVILMDQSVYSFLLYFYAPSTLTGWRALKQWTKKLLFLLHLTTNAWLYQAMKETEMDGRGKIATREEIFSGMCLCILCVC